MPIKEPYSPINLKLNIFYITRHKTTQRECMCINT